MLRRPPTSIELKMEDIREYDAVRQQLAKNQEMPKTETETWAIPRKTKEEVYLRIGYNPNKVQTSTVP